MLIQKTESFQNTSAQKLSPRNVGWMEYPWVPQAALGHTCARARAPTVYVVKMSFVGVCGFVCDSIKVCKIYIYLQVYTNIISSVFKIHSARQFLEPCLDEWSCSHRILTFRFSFCVVNLERVPYPLHCYYGPIRLWAPDSTILREFGINTVIY